MRIFSHFDLSDRKNVADKNNEFTGKGHIPLLDVVQLQASLSRNTKTNKSLLQASRSVTTAYPHFAKRQQTC